MLGLHCDASTGVGEADGVPDQVPDDLAQPDRFRADGAGGSQVEGGGQPRRVDVRLERLHELIDDVVDRDVVDPDDELVLGDARQIEEVVDQARFDRDVAVDHGEGLAEGVRERGVVLPRGGREQNRHQRGAELVAQNGDEAILGRAVRARDRAFVLDPSPLLADASPLVLDPLPPPEVDDARVVAGLVIALDAEGATRQLDQDLDAAPRPDRQLRRHRRVGAATATHVLEPDPTIALDDEDEQGTLAETRGLASDEIGSSEVTALDDAVAVEDEARDRPDVEELDVLVVPELDFPPRLDQLRMLGGKLLAVHPQLVS